VYVRKIILATFYEVIFFYFSQHNVSIFHNETLPLNITLNYFHILQTLSENRKVSKIKVAYPIKRFFFANKEVFFIFCSEARSFH